MKIKNLWRTKLVLASFLLFGVVSFASAYQLYFAPSTVSVHLNCTTWGVYLMVSGAAYNGYQFDILEQSSIKYVSPAINGYTTNNFVSQSIVPSYFIDGSYVLRMIGVHNPSNTDATGISSGWRILLQNSWFLRTWIVNLKSNTSSITKAWQGQTNYLQSTWSLAVDFYLGPCTVTDGVSPTFGFTGWMTPHATNYTSPQFNDRTYVFDVRDPGSIDRWFTSGFTNDRDADWTGGTYYANSVINGSGIDLATFTMQIGVETTPSSSSFSVITLTWTLNSTWWNAITWSDPGLVFYPYDFTRNRLNRNYTWYALTGTLWPTSSVDIDGYLSFGTEQEVIMTGYVRDRANNISNTFTRHFNYGANPWSSNVEEAGLVVGCGPDGSSTIGVNTAPTSDSGAYIQKYNSGFYLRPFKVFLHDDWAGIDTWTITVTITGQQWWSPFTVVLNAADLTLTPFSRVGPINVLTDRWVNENVYSVTGSTRNYEVLVNYTGKRDPETQISVSVNYKDLVNRAWSEVACSYVSTVAPYSNAWTGDVHLLRTPYPMGGILSGFVIDLQDEWAGVDSGTIVLTISWYTFTGGALTPVLLVYTWSTDLGARLSEYSTSPAGILDSQLYNYTVTVPNSSDYLSGYFAPERPILVTVSYKDLRVPTPNSNGSNQGININENPMLRGYSAVASINRWVAFPLSTYSATSGNTQFSGLEFSIMDHWAGVSGDYNLVIITGSRRWSPAKYVFTTPTSTLSETCVGNCLTGDMTSSEMIVPDYDSYNAQHPTIQQSTWYQFQITGHSIYFDYGVYGSPSVYGVDVYMSDLKPDTPNSLVSGASLTLPTLACMFLDRCSHDQLTFVRWSGVTDMTQTIDMNPLTGTIDGNIVDIFGGSRVSVIGSGVWIDTWTSVLYCNAAWGLLDTPITLDFNNVNQLPDTPSSTWYSDITLKVADGLFLLSGDVLIVQ